jgi:hypothetical protein
VVVLDVAVAASEDEAAMATAGAAGSQRRGVLVGNVYGGSWASSEAPKEACLYPGRVGLVCGPTCWPSGGPLLRIAAT